MDKEKYMDILSTIAAGTLVVRDTCQEEGALAEFQTILNEAVSSMTFLACLISIMPDEVFANAYTSFKLAEMMTGAPDCLKAEPSPPIVKADEGVKN